MSDDPLDLLRAAWKLVGEDVLDAEPVSDEATERSVGWMQSAWREVASPRSGRSGAAEFSRLRQKASDRQAADNRRWLAAAALLLVTAGGLAFAVGVRRMSEVRVSDRVASFEGGSTRPQPERGTRVTSISRDRIEMRSGSVRLVLLTPDSDSQETE